MTEITIKGLDELRAALDQFSDRRFNAAIATALTRTASKVRDSMRIEMARTLDRPTPYTLNSLYVKIATADNLNASVKFKDSKAESGSNTPAASYMLPNVEGGKRKTKGFEAALRSMGALPEGWLVVPGPGATLDIYGNVSRGQVQQILAQLKTGSVKAGAQRKAGGQYFVLMPGAKAAPGIYQRELLGRNVTPVFLYVSTATYRQRLDFYGKGKDVIEANLSNEIEVSVREHIARLAKK